MLVRRQLDTLLFAPAVQTRLAAASKPFEKLLSTTAYIGFSLVIQPLIAFLRAPAVEARFAPAVKPLGILLAAAAADDIAGAAALGWSIRGPGGCHWPTLEVRAEAALAGRRRKGLFTDSAV